VSMMLVHLHHEVGASAALELVTLCRTSRDEERVDDVHTWSTVPPGGCYALHPPESTRPASPGLGMPMFPRHTTEISALAPTTSTASVHGYDCVRSRPRDIQDVWPRRVRKYILLAGHMSTERRRAKMEATQQAMQEVREPFHAWRRASCSLTAPDANEPGPRGR
jgi:hypothetical protein